MIYVIKFKFAGSGDFVWRKVVNGKVSRNQDDLVRIVEKGGKEYIAYSSDVEKAYGHMQYAKSESINSTGTVMTVLDKGAMARDFGKQGTPAYIWIKEKSKTVLGSNERTEVIEITIPGPHAFGGAADLGSFSIKQNVSKSMKVIGTYIDKYAHEGNTVYIKIKGHSRGGVAANIVLKNLLQTYRSNRFVEICAVTFDPVPGPSAISDRESKNGEYEKMVLNDIKQGAVVYSVNPDKIGGFKPQKVYTYPVTIISELDHSVGLYKTSLDGRRKAGYEFEGSIYSPGKLYKLPKNHLYWANRNLNLQIVDADNYKQKIDFIKLKGANDRKKFLKNLIYNKVITQDMISGVVVGGSANCQNILKGLSELFYGDIKFGNLMNELLNMLPRKTASASLLAVEKTAPAMLKKVADYKSQVKTDVKRKAAEALERYLGTI